MASSTSQHPGPSYPQQSSRSSESAAKLLVIIPDRIDVEEEARLYDELCEVCLISSAYLLVSHFRRVLLLVRATRVSLVTTQITRDRLLRH